MLRGDALHRLNRPAFTLEESYWLKSLIEARVPGRPLERTFYSSPAIFELEMEQIFLRHWLFVDHISRIPKPGDYFLYEIGGESIIFARGDDHECDKSDGYACLEL